MRHFGRSGRLDFSRIAQEWLREAAKSWAAAALASRNHQLVRVRVHAVAVLSGCSPPVPLAATIPAALSRADIDRFLVRVRSAVSPSTGQPYTARRQATIVEDCAFVLRDCRDMGLLSGLAPTFAIRRGDAGRNLAGEEDRAAPSHRISSPSSTTNSSCCAPSPARRAARRTTTSASSATAPGRWRCSPTCS